MADVLPSFADWSTTESANQPEGADIAGAGIAPNFRQIQASTRAWLASPGADIAAAGTVNLNVAGSTHRITGAATINSFGTVSAGIRKRLQFLGVCTITYNAASMITAGATNIVTAAGDWMDVESLGAGNWAVIEVYRAAGAVVPNRPNGDATAFAANTQFVSTAVANSLTTVPTRPAGDSTTNAANTAFVTGAVTAAYATTPNRPANDSTANAANTAFVTGAINSALSPTFRPKLQVLLEGQLGLSTTSTTFFLGTLPSQTVAGTWIISVSGDLDIDSTMSRVAMNIGDFASVGASAGIGFPMLNKFNATSVSAAELRPVSLIHRLNVSAGQAIDVGIASQTLANSFGRFFTIKQSHAIFIPN